MCLRVVFLLVSIIVLSKAQTLLGLDEGDTCKKVAEAPWVCSSLKKCAHIDVKILRPSICSFRGREPIICCPPKKMGKAEMSCLNNAPLCNKFNMFRGTEESMKRPNTLDWSVIGDDAVVLEIPDGPETQETLSKSAQSTTQRNEIPSSTAVVDMTSTEAADSSSPTPESAQPLNQSTKSTPIGRQVVGGHLSLPRIHRHMVAIGYGKPNEISWNCGGSLVSELWVMSAAHCTSSPDLGEAKWARLGDLDLASTSEDARPQDRRIVRRVNHPQYRPPAAYHDISLYKLDTPVVFNQYIAPVCLHTTFGIDENKATVVGWGSTEFAGSTSSKLMEVDVTLVGHEECRQRYGSEDQQAPRGIDNAAMVCAGEKEGGKDACTGDSGGPLAVNQPGTCLKKQVGITSFGRDCGLPNTPGVYTRVSTYVPWIESIVWP